jgi:alginate O-acetyltransferase complex protein AlgI
LLPLGISFFTFHSISYLVDVYLKKVKPQKNIIDLSLYISFFPQLIAGPIVRYIDVSEQLQNRILTIPNAAKGMQRFIFGLAKKVIVANTLALLSDKIINAPIDTLSSIASWIGIVAYTLQIYFDFSGYSDMAIGLALIFGFKFPENFNYPYASGSIKEFWRKWHISLSTWFRDFLYIPLGGNKLGNTRTNINLIIVFFCTGFWHGASWCFIIWGLYHGIFLFLERSTFGNLLSKVPKFLQVFYTIFIVMIGWVFFRIENIRSAFDYISKMFYLNQQDTNLVINLEGILNKKTTVVLVFAILYSLRFFRYLQGFTHRKFIQFEKENIFKISFQVTKLIVSITLFFVTILYMTSSTYSPFIYFRF